MRYRGHYTTQTFSQRNDQSDIHETWHKPADPHPDPKSKKQLCINKIGGAYTVIIIFFYKISHEAYSHIFYKVFNGKILKKGTAVSVKWHWTFKKLSPPKAQIG